MLRVSSEDKNVFKQILFGNRTDEKLPLPRATSLLFLRVIKSNEVFYVYGWCVLLFEVFQPKRDFPNRFFVPISSKVRV